MVGGARDSHRDMLCTGGHAQDRPVLLHCQLGISRSVTMIIGYLMHLSAWKLKPAEALKYVQSRRRIASPHYGFLIQLEDIRATILHSSKSNDLVYANSAP